MSEIFKEIKNRISKARTGHYVKKGRFKKELSGHSGNAKINEKLNGWLNNRLNMAEKKVNDLEDRSGEIIHGTALRH